MEIRVYFIKILRERNTTGRYEQKNRKEKS
jgi:hypothetical protein